MTDERTPRPDRSDDPQEDTVDTRISDLTGAPPDEDRTDTRPLDVDPVDHRYDDTRYDDDAAATRPLTVDEPVGTTGADDTSAASAAPVEADRAERPRGPRVGTVVWGLVIAAIGVGLLAVASGASLDVELAIIVLVAAAGVALLVGSLLTARRRRG